jgi:hypothetical protein
VSLKHARSIFGELTSKTRNNAEAGGTTPAKTGN